MISLFVENDTKPFSKLQTITKRQMCTVFQPISIDISSTEGLFLIILYTGFRVISELPLISIKANTTSKRVLIDCFWGNANYFKSNSKPFIWGTNKQLEFICFFTVLIQCLKKFRQVWL